MAVTPTALTEAEAPPDLAAIVAKAMEKDPANRYQHMVEMMAALTKFLQAYDRQTREIAAKACEAFNENARLIAERKLTEEVAAVPFLRDLPLFQDRGAEVLKVVPFRRAKITEIMRVLEEQHARLAAG